MTDNYAEAKVLSVRIDELTKYIDTLELLKKAKLGVNIGLVDDLEENLKHVKDTLTTRWNTIYRDVADMSDLFFDLD